MFSENLRMILSSYGLLSAEPSPVNQMMSEFAKDFRPGLDINLGVGYVNEDTIPYDWFGKVVQKILEKSKRPPNLLNYGGPKGSERLISVIREFYKSLSNTGRIGRIPDFEQRDIVIGVSGATSILTGLANVIRKGVVVTADPVYYIYTSTLERFGFEIEPVEEDKEGPRTDVLNEVLNKLEREGRFVSFCYFVTVNNPTCNVISNRRRKEIVECVMSFGRRNGKFVPIVFDLAYEWLAHGENLEKLDLPSVYDEDGIVYEVGTLSKVFAPALRVGFLMGPKGSPIITSLIQWNSDVGFSAPLVTQEISVELIGEFGLQQFDKVNKGYKEKARLFKEKVLSELGEFLEALSGGEAGFYLYLTFKNLETFPGSEFFKMLSRKSGDKKWDISNGELNPRIIYLPGVYCVHPRGNLAEKGKKQIRVSYGYENSDVLGRAVDIMKEAICYLLT